MSPDEWIDDVRSDRPKHEMLAIHKSGHVLAMGRNYAVKAAGNVSMNVRVPDLNEIDYVTHVQLETDPITYHQGVMNKKVVGNVVGLTIMQLNAGTTLTIEVQAIGQPS